MTNAISGEIDLSEPMKRALRRIELDLQRKYVVAALTRTAGSVGLAARALGVSRRTVTALIARFKLDRNQFREAVVANCAHCDAQPDGASPCH